MSDEVQTVAAQRAMQLVDALWNDQVAGKAIQKKAKEFWPDAVKTNDEIYGHVIDPLMNEAKGIRDELAALKAERDAERKIADESKQRANLQQALDDARAKFGLTDDGFNQMVERMKATNNFTDAEAAAAWVHAKNPPESVKGPTWGPRSINMNPLDDDRRKRLHADPQRFMDDELDNFLADPDRYTRESIGQAA